MLRVTAILVSIILGAPVWAAKPPEPACGAVLGGKKPTARGEVTEFPNDSVHYLRDKINLEFLQNFYDFNRCLESADFFLPCIKALNGLIRNGQIERMLLPKSLVASYAQDIASVEKIFGPLAIVKLVPVENRRKVGSFREAAELAVKQNDDYADAVFDLFPARSLDLVELKNYIFGLIRGTKEEGRRVFEAINDTAKIFDAHARLISMSADEAFENARGAEQMIGIGLNFTTIGKNLVVTSTLESGPADRAGILVHDKIVSVNGIDLRALTDAQMDTVLGGPVGTTLLMKVERDGRMLELPVTRAVVSFPNVTSRIVDEVRGKKVGYIKLRTFNTPSACADLIAALRGLVNRGAEGLVVDVRDDGGGYLTQARCIGGVFLGKELIVYTKNLMTGKVTPYYSEHKKLTDLPMVVLINGESLSAAEVFAGAIRDHHRGWVLGERSHGKGTMQEAEPVDNLDQDKARVFYYKTTDRIYQPSGTSNQLYGIQPQFEVTRMPDGVPSSSMREEDIYCNAVPPSRRNWSEDRPEELSVLKECIEKKGRAKQIWQRLRDQNKFADYQLLYAIDVLNCQY